jgi:iron complex outermembrane recepter protein
MKATTARALVLRSAARIAMSSATLACMFASHAALAQNAPPASSETTDDGTIIVTAQRREQALMSVPQAVQGLSGESLLRNGVTDIAQAISLVPSATTGATIGAGSTTYQIRAIAASETDGDPAVGYYLDNFAFTMPGRPYAPVATFYDLQRVEVLRGPSGTLYGLGSIGGTIKVLTKDPELDRTGGSVRASGNLVTGGKPGFSGDVMLNLPIINDKLALRGVLSYKRVGGYADIIPTGVRNDNPATTFTGRIKLLAKPTEDLTIRLSAWRNNTKQRWSDRITFAEPASIDQQFGEALSDYWLFSGDIEYDLGFATIQSSTGHIKNSVISNNGGFIPGIGNFVSLWPLTTHNFNEDLRLTSNGSGPLQYIFGFFYQNGDTFGGQTVQLPDFVVAPGVNGFNTVNDRNQLFSTGWAVYGQATYSVFDRKLDLTVGGRYYQERRRFVENSQLEIAGSVIPNQSTTRSSSSTFNPRFNLAYHAGQSGLLYVEAAKGFRSGAISSASIVGASNAVLGVNLSNISPPDTLWNYEAGMKWSLFDNTVQFELAGYYVDWPRAQIELSPALQTIVAQVGDVRGYGIEPSITWRTPLRGLTLNFNGNFNSTTIRNVAAPIVARIPQLRDGNQLPGTAKTTFNLGGSYQTPIGGNGLELRLNARYSYRSRQQSIFNGVYAPFNGIGYARASIGTDRWEAGIFTDNIGNTVGPLNRPGGQNQIVYPRTIGISLEGRF